MGTKQVRITDEAVLIIRKYATNDSLTRGIIEMERRLNTVTTSNAKEKFASTPVPDVSGKPYWQKLKETVIEAIQEVQR
jgi:hypothetical protein